MQIKTFIVLVALSIGFVTVGVAQPKNYNIKNGIGIGGGLTQYDIITDNFETKKGNGWMAAAAASVELPNKWYTVSYNIQLSENKMEISGRSSAIGGTEEMLEYKLFAAQIGFNFHLKIIQQHLTLDFGPQLQFNGKLELEDDTQENYFVNGYDTLLASDISDISQFNANGAVGASAGFGAFRLRAQYIYGFTNIFNKLNDQDLNIGSNGDRFKGNQSMITGSVLFIF